MTYADLAAEEHQDAHRSSAMIAERIKEIRKGMEWDEISATRRFWVRKRGAVPLHTPTRYSPGTAHFTPISGHLTPFSSLYPPPFCTAGQRVSTIGLVSSACACYEA